MRRTTAAVLGLALLSACYPNGPTPEPTANPLQAEITVEAYLAATDTPEPTSTPTAISTDAPRGIEAPTPGPVERIYGSELVATYRIEDVWTCGSTVNVCLLKEPADLVLARVALGEAPESADDQVFVMWLIRLRAELGFKHAGVAGDGCGWCGDRWCYTPGRWGSPTTIHQEALCVGGCQFSPVEVAQAIWFPCLLSASHPLRKMLCPTADQLADFRFAVEAADRILTAPISEFPAELRGYDNFRSPTIVGEGQCNRSPCGMRSRQFFRGGNIWRDEFVDDNIYWDQREAALVGAVLKELKP